MPNGDTMQAPTPSSGDTALQAASQQVAQPHTALPAPMPQQPARMTHATGLLGMLTMEIQNAYAAHKEKKIQDAMANYMTYANAHTKAEDMVNKSGITDPAQRQQMMTQFVSNDPSVKAVFHGPKGQANVKAMKDILKVDFTDPESMNTVQHQALQRVAKAIGVQKVMAMIGTLRQQHGQRQQGQGGLPGALGAGGALSKPPQDPLAASVAARAEAQATPLPIDVKNAIEIKKAEMGDLRAQIAESKNVSDTKKWQAQLEEKQKEHADLLVEVDKKLAQQKVESDTRMAEAKKKMDLQARVEQDRVSIANARNQLMQSRLDIQKGTADGSLPTMDIKTRGQLSKQLLNKMDSAKIEGQVDAMSSKLGPGVGTISDLIYQKGGFANPEYTTLRTDLKLIGSGLGRAHLGGRVGGTAALKYFTDMFGNTSASPENIKAALGATRETLKGYADAVPEFTGKPGGGPSGVISFTDAGTTYDIPKDKVAAFKKAHPNATTAR